jgi:hypothetical protein
MKNRLEEGGRERREEGRREGGEGGRGEGEEINLPLTPSGTIFRKFRNPYNQFCQMYFTGRPETLIRRIKRKKRRRGG